MRNLRRNALQSVLLIDRNLKPKKIKKTPKNGCLFNTAC
ncbi:transcription antiterminator BglG, partial [Escherichia coli]